MIINQTYVIVYVTYRRSFFVQVSNVHLLSLSSAAGTVSAHARFPLAMEHMASNGQKLENKFHVRTYHLKKKEKKN